jgi:hypothetical protein
MRALKLLAPFVGAMAMILGLQSWAMPQRETWLARRSPSWVDIDPESGMSCLIANDYYVVHLSTYSQQETSKFDAKHPEALRPHCKNARLTGKTLFSLDLIDRVSRTLPIAVSLHQRKDDGGSALVQELPAMMYPSGVVQLTSDIAQPGKYAIRLAFGQVKGPDDTLEVPVSVGFSAD